MNRVLNRRMRDLYNPINTQPVDGKLKGSFFTYQRLCENSLATWWRNVFLMTNVAVAVGNRGDENEFVTILLLGANLMLAWATISYYNNLRNIVQAASEKGLTLDSNWSWLIFGIVFWGIHLYFTIKSFTSI